MSALKLLALLSSARRIQGLALACVVAVVCCGLPARAAVDDREELPDRHHLPDARQLLDSVLKSLPSVPLKIISQLQARTREGKLDRTLNAEMKLNWRASQPTAKYTIRDAFGRDLEGLDVVLNADGSREVRYYKGDPLVSAPPPDLYGPIQDTDVNWTDLSLSFLWWPGGRTVGAEEIKGRFCYIIDLPAPEAEPGAYAGMRLWIDPQIHILLQAAGYDGTGQMVKLLEVKSFKKIRDVWVIQNLDMQSFPSRHKTSLKVKSVDVLEDGKPVVSADSTDKPAEK